jgi:hypothetical protein
MQTHLIIIFLCIFSAKSFAQNAFHPYESKILSTWSPENFTDPTTFERKTNFRFLYHEISGGVRSLDSKRWSYRLLKNPELIENNPRVSYSLISEKQRGVFVGNLGLILEVPTDNIVTTSKVDIGSGFTGTNRDLISMANERPLVTPKKLIKLTKGYGYNEIVAVGTAATNTKIRALAIAIPCGQDINLSSNSNGSKRSEVSFEEEFEKCVDGNNKEFRRYEFDKALKPLLKEAMSKGYTVLGLVLTR